MSDNTRLFKALGLTLFSLAWAVLFAVALAFIFKMIGATGLLVLVGIVGFSLIFWLIYLSLGD
jgi:hypothetical protein